MTSAQKFLSLADGYLEILLEFEECRKQLLRALANGDFQAMEQAVAREDSLRAAGEELLARLSKIHRQRIENGECGRMDEKERKRGSLLLAALASRDL